MGRDGDEKPEKFQARKVGKVIIAHYHQLHPVCGRLARSARSPALAPRTSALGGAPRHTEVR